MGGHQPITNLHTGLIAKVAKLSELDGVYMIHDLDTLAEPGALVIRLPTRVGAPEQGFRIVVERPDTRHLFIRGPVTLTDLSRLEQSLITLANRTIPKPFLREIVKERIERLCTAFPSGKEFSSVTALNIDLMSWVLPRLGVAVQRTILLSELLNMETSKEALGQVVREVGVEGFWLWERESSTRIALPSLSGVDELIGRGALIPQAIALGKLTRLLGYSVIRGTGQARYENGFSGADDMTVTSCQGVPPLWAALVSPGFRPSALLLYLMGGQFDRGLIEVT